MLKNIGLLLSALLAGLICALAGGFEGLTWLWILPVGFLGSLLALGLLFFLVLWLSCAFVNLEKPQEKDSKFHRWLVGNTAELVLWILRARVHTRGLEQMPKDGRFLLVCNHINDLDPVTLLAYFKKKQLAFISKQENASMFIVGKIMHKIQCQRINRENDREALRTIINCIKIIQEDRASIGVFPEGYTSLDGLLHPFRSGVFKIALKTNVPIVVCTLQNTNKVFRNIKHLKATDVHLHLLKVLQPEDYAGKTAVEVGDLVHSMMAADLGPELVLQEST
ncbi:MAG: 1-acyl-sn-glycerol-3-phosphate acyltransferase [Oscillospiraceae bacterium]|nr:1-acyl-sn-glycerol-3-phosphate acyltransferase [Oscillospiraceae bacterium]